MRRGTEEQGQRDTEMRFKFVTTNESTAVKWHSHLFECVSVVGRRLLDKLQFFSSSLFLFIAFIILFHLLFITIFRFFLVVVGCACMPAVQLHQSRTHSSGSSSFSQCLVADSVINDVFEGLWVRNARTCMKI